MDISDAIAIVFGFSGAVLGFMGWRKASEANRLSSESNTIAWSSKTTAEEANRLATDGNMLAGNANRLAGEANAIATESKTIAEASNRIAVEANDISREANSVAKEDIEHRRRGEEQANTAVLEIPDDGPIWVYNQKGTIARIGVHMLNKGAGELRDLTMTAYVDGTPMAVEKGTIHRMTRDDRQDIRLLFQIPLDDSWAAPENHSIRVQFNFTDGTGPREESYCFQFTGTDPQNWKSRTVLCH